MFNFKQIINKKNVSISPGVLFWIPAFAGMTVTRDSSDLNSNE
jgi:hypothetical protein